MNSTKHFIRHFFIQIALASFLVSIPATSLAMATNFKSGVVTNAECNNLGVNCAAADTFDIVGDRMVIVINAFLLMISSIAFGAVVYYGALYIVSRGDEERARKAKNGLIFSMLGLVIIGLSGWLVNSVLNL